MSDEMSNRQIFLMLVQTALLAAQNSGQLSAARVKGGFAEAIFIPAQAIPLENSELVRMAQEFVDWNINGNRPAWYLNEWIPDDW